MNVVHKIEHWGDAHHPLLLDIIRIALGAFLLLKGLAFMQNSTYLQALIQSQKMVFISAGFLMAIVYYVTFAHLVGGTLIMMGIWTRFACVIQIPIVLAAVFFTGFFIEPVNAMLWPSITALVLLGLFAIIGSGPLSLDNYLSRWES